MQLLDASLGYIATARHKGLRQGVMQGLFERGGSLHAVHERVRELLHSLGEEPLDDLSRQRQVSHTHRFPHIWHIPFFLCITPDSSSQI